MNHSSVKPAENLLVNGPAGNDRTARHKSPAQAFRHSDDVRLKVPMFESPHLTAAPESALYFVADDQHPMSPTEGLSFLIKVVRRIVDPFSLDRFEQESCHVPFSKQLFQCNQIAHSHPCHIGQKRAESFLKIAASGNRERTIAQSVITAFQTDDPGSSGGRSRKLYGPFNGFRSGI